MTNFKRKGATADRVDERIWEAWLRKSRKKERIRVARLQMIGLVVALPIAGAVFWWLAS